MKKILSKNIIAVSTATLVLGATSVVEPAAFAAGMGGSLKDMIKDVQTPEQRLETEIINSIKNTSINFAGYSIDQISPYIQFDRNNSKYFLTDEGKSILPVEVILQVEKTLNEQNQVRSETILENSNKDGVEIVEKPNGVLEVVPEDDSMDNMLRYKNGVTKIDFYWWGSRVYISKSDLNNLNSMIIIGNKVIPSKIITTALSFVGVAAKSSPGGIVFDTSFPFGVGMVVRNVKMQ